MYAYTHAQTKEKILETIKEKGPCLPVHIAKTIRVSPLFSAAFLSELYQEGKLRMSHMRVGSSPLYMLPGQEPQLENYIQFLNQKEKEACMLLKNNKILLDEKLHPAIRVALRSLKDFAIPFKININGEDKTHWRYFTELEETPQILPKAAEKEIPQQPVVMPQQPIIEKQIEKPQIIQEIKKVEKEIEQQTEISEIETIKEVKKVKKKAPKEDSNFQKKLKNYFENKSIKILETILDKKKEFIAKASIDTVIGKQTYYLIAKDKKKITESDIALAVQKASMEKMPILILSPGEVDKKAIPYIGTGGSLLKIEFLK